MARAGDMQTVFTHIDEYPWHGMLTEVAGGNDVLIQDTNHRCKRDQGEHDQERARQPKGGLRHYFASLTSPRCIREHDNITSNLPMISSRSNKLRRVVVRQQAPTRRLIRIQAEQLGAIRDAW